MPHESHQGKSESGDKRGSNSVPLRFGSIRDGAASRRYSTSLVSLANSAKMMDFPTNEVIEGQKFLKNIPRKILRNAENYASIVWNLRRRSSREETRREVQYIEDRLRNDAQHEATRRKISKRPRFQKMARGNSLRDLPEWLS